MSAGLKCNRIFGVLWTLVLKFQKWFSWEILKLARLELMNTQRRTWRLNRWYTICNLRWRIHHSGTSKFGERSSFEGRIYFNASILVKMACIYKYEYEGTTNMMVGMVKKVNYNEDNSVCSIEVLQCPPRGATKDNLYVDICWFCFPSQLLHQSHWRSWTRNAACVQHWQW